MAMHSVIRFVAVAFQFEEVSKRRPRDLFWPGTRSASGFNSFGIEASDLNLLSYFILPGPDDGSKAEMPICSILLKQSDFKTVNPL